MAVSDGRIAYALAGLRIISEVPLPTSLGADDSSADSETITMRLGPVPESLPGAVAYPEAQVGADELLVDIPDVARFLVRSGTEIIVSPAAGADQGDIAAWLLGTVFAGLCHQRGIMPLHGSAIDVEGGCAVFVGASGSGKSTLAAALATRGHQVISDDVCFLRRDDDGGIKVWPGIGRIRLWPDAMEALGYDSDSIERELRGLNKFLVPIQSPKELLRPRRLRSVYQLEAATVENDLSIEELSGAATIELLMPNVYRLTLAEYMGRKAAIFAFCTKIANDVPVYRFRRRVEFGSLSPALDRLEAHLRDAS